MKSTPLVILTALIIISCNKPPERPTLASGSIDRLADFGSEFVTPRNVDVWLPEGYSADQQYAVLYMHDGQMLYDSTITWNKQEWQVDEVVSSLIEKETIKPCVVVSIWNAGEERHTDYFPQKPFEQVKTSVGDSLLAANPEAFDGLRMTAQSDAYLKFIVEELKPYVDNNYSVYTDPANTYIMGSSMGGLISMYALAEYPEIFGGAACLSTHWIGFWVENEIFPRAFGHYLEAKLPALTGKKLYFDHGTETLDAKYGRAQEYIDDLIESDTTSGLIYYSAVFEGMAHDEVSWASRLDIPLTFLLGN